jgi:hypothetical protein
VTVNLEDVNAFVAQLEVPLTLPNNEPVNDDAFIEPVTIKDPVIIVDPVIMTVWFNELIEDAVEANEALTAFKTYDAVKALTTYEAVAAYDALNANKAYEAVATEPDCDTVIGNVVPSPFVNVIVVLVAEAVIIPNNGNDDVIAYEALKAFEELKAYEALVAVSEYDELKAYDELIAYEALKAVRE